MICNWITVDNKDSVFCIHIKRIKSVLMLNILTNNKSPHVQFPWEFFKRILLNEKDWNSD